MISEEKQKSIVAALAGLFAGFIAALFLDLDGLWLIISVTFFVMFWELMFSVPKALQRSENVWTGWFFHFSVTIAFLVTCFITGVHMFEPIIFETQVGPAEFEFLTNPAETWWWLITPVVLRLSVIQIILLLVAKRK